MTLESLILAALLSLPNTSFREAPERAPMVAQAIGRACAGDARLCALMVSVGFHESRFLDRIQAGQCRPPRRGYAGECDAFVTRGGEVRYRSRSYWQLQRGATASFDEWVSTTGLEPQNVSAAADIAGRRIRRGLRACGTLDGAVAYYAFGGCRWIGSARRVALARKIESQLRSAPRS